jgi:hypothetical protein
MISWDKCARDFHWDGSLRDIYIRPATLDDWRVIYGFLRAHPDSEYSVDGVTKTFPAAIEEAFAAGTVAHPMLRVRVGRTLVVFHFFSVDEVECDIDPREVISQSELDSLLDFVQRLGDLVNKTVRITPENLPDEPFIVYEPNRRAFRHLET